jgi:hypothetical protein
MRLDPASSQAGDVEDPVRPRTGSDHSRVVDWFALTDSNLPEPEIAVAPVVSQRPAPEAVAAATGSPTGAWRALQVGTRRLWRELLDRRRRPAGGAAPKLPPVAGGSQ